MCGEINNNAALLFIMQAATDRKLQHRQQKKILPATKSISSNKEKKQAKRQVGKVKHNSARPQTAF